MTVREGYLLEDCALSQVLCEGPVMLLFHLIHTVVSVLSTLESETALRNIRVLPSTAMVEGSQDLCV